MGLTRSLCCRRLSFTDATSCPMCGKSFQPGALQAKAIAEENAFSIKAQMIFLGVFLTLFGVLVFVQFQPFLDGVGN